MRDAVADEGSGLETATSPDSFFLKFKNIQKWTEYLGGGKSKAETP